MTEEIEPPVDAATPEVEEATLGSTMQSAQLTPIHTAPQTAKAKKEGDEEAADGDGENDKEGEEEKPPEEKKRNTGLLFTWGNNAAGRLGNGDVEEESIYAPETVNKLLDVTFIEVCGGREHTAGVDQKGKLWTWGGSEDARLGHGDDEDVDEPKVVEYFQKNKIAIMSCSLGSNHTVALSSKGDAYSWGSSKYGRLGRGPETDETDDPKLIPFPSDVLILQVACGSGHTIVRDNDGRVFSFGKGTDGQLGHGEHQNENTPRLVESLKGKGIVIDVAVGLFHSAVVTDENELYTFGLGSKGQLGHGDDWDCFLPERVKAAGLEHFVERVWCGDSYTFALMANGELYSFGDNKHGQLGRPTSNQDSAAASKDADPTPCVVSSIATITRRFKEVACGANHTLVLSKSGDVYAFGLNKDGELGLGDTMPRTEPVVVSSLQHTVVVSVAVGVKHSLAITIPFNTVDTFACILERTKFEVIELGFVVSDFVERQEAKQDLLKQRGASMLEQTLVERGVNTDVDLGNVQILDGYEASLRELFQVVLKDVDVTETEGRMPLNVLRELMAQDLELEKHHIEYLCSLIERLDGTIAEDEFVGLLVNVNLEAAAPTENI